MSTLSRLVVNNEKPSRFRELPLRTLTRFVLGNTLMMQIQIKTDHNIEGHQELVAEISGKNRRCTESVQQLNHED